MRLVRLMGDVPGPGYQVATIHSELGGAGTEGNTLLTIAGMSVADAQGKLTLSTGSVGNAYLYVAYTGQGRTDPVPSAGSFRLVFPGKARQGPHPGGNRP